MSITTEASPEVMIRDRHRELLSTFREFTRSLDGMEPAEPDPASLHAVIAFLRQGLLPCAHGEEGQLDGRAVITEDAAFEHAFLNAEIDALVTAVADLRRDAERNRSELLQCILRSAYRIEAVLELHVQKAEDRESLFFAPGSLREDHSEATAGLSTKMDSGEVHRFLMRHAWGMLCSVGEGRPYAVPVSYGFDGRDLYLASGPGRKLRNLEACPAVCLTIADVENGSHWSSVVVSGDAHPVIHVRRKLHALKTLHRQRPTGVPPSATDIARLARASIFRIVPDEITGRVRG